MMKVSIVAVTLGVVLVAGQAWATSSQAVAGRVGDRVGQELGATSAWGLPDRSVLPPLPVAIIGTAVITAAIIAAVDDASESD